MTETTTTLLKVKDARIIDIQTDQYESGGGCDTCDYGKTYTADVTVEYVMDGSDKVLSKTFSSESPFSFSISLASLLKFFGNNKLDTMPINEVLENLGKTLFP